MFLSQQIPYWLQQIKIGQRVRSNSVKTSRGASDSRPEQLRQRHNRWAESLFSHSLSHSPALCLRLSHWTVFFGLLWIVLPRDWMAHWSCSFVLASEHHSVPAACQYRDQCECAAKSCDWRISLQCVWCPVNQVMFMNCSCIMNLVSSK